MKTGCAKKGTTYQVCYPDKGSPTSYSYKTFERKKDARAPSLRTPDFQRTFAIDAWLRVCEKVGRDGREKVEPQTFNEYQRRANAMNEYDWRKKAHELEPADIIAFRHWLLENKTRDLARRSAHSRSTRSCRSTPSTIGGFAASICCSPRPRTRAVQPIRHLLLPRRQDPRPQAQQLLGAAVRLGAG
jgi:hypothetical protein